MNITKCPDCGFQLGVELLESGEYNCANCKHRWQDLKFPQGTEADVCADIAKRQEHGFKKYGTTVRDNPLTLEQWLQHAYEETLDKAIYLKRAIEEIDKTPPKQDLYERLLEANKAGGGGIISALELEKPLTADDVLKVAEFFNHSLAIEKPDRRHNPCDYWGCLGEDHNPACPKNPDRVLPLTEEQRQETVNKEIEELAAKPSFYITTTHGMRGWFAVMIRVENDCFEEPQQTHPASHADRFTAQQDAQAWADDEELEYRP